jgi:hypothetical protein
MQLLKCRKSLRFFFLSQEKQDSLVSNIQKSSHRVSMVEYVEKEELMTKPNERKLDEGSFQLFIYFLQK